MRAVLSVRLKLIFLALSVLSCSPKSIYKREIPEPGLAQKARGGSYMNPAVDVLFVIDDSGSMGTYQTNLSNAADQFVQAMAQGSSLDYRIAVTTTSVGSSYTYPGANGTFFNNGGATSAVVSRTTPNAMQDLKTNMMVGTGGSGGEAMFDPIMMALDRSALASTNKGFYRPSAFLAIIIITDTGEQSENIKDPKIVLQYLWGLKGFDKSKVLVYGAMADKISKDATGVDCSGEGNDQSTLETFFKDTNAKIFSLCDPQFGTNFASFGKDIRVKVGRSIYLDRLPVLHTLKVSIGTTELPREHRMGWSYNPERNSIELGDGIKWDDYASGARPEVDYLPVGEEED